MIPDRIEPQSDVPRDDTAPIDPWELLQVERKLHADELAKADARYDEKHDAMVDVLAERDQLRTCLRAISAAVTGSGDSSEAEVMDCIDKLTNYFADGECRATSERQAPAREHVLANARLVASNVDTLARRLRDYAGNGTQMDKDMLAAAQIIQFDFAPDWIAAALMARDTADPLHIELGHGAITVGQGHHGADRLPAILFGRNGTGHIGEESDGDRFMDSGECLAAVTFRNRASLDVVIEKLNELRDRIWPDSLVEPAPAWNTNRDMRLVSVSNQRLHKGYDAVRYRDPPACYDFDVEGKTLTLSRDEIDAELTARGIPPIPF